MSNRRKSAIAPAALCAWCLVCGFSPWALAEDAGSAAEPGAAGAAESTPVEAVATPDAAEAGTAPAAEPTTTNEAAEPPPATNAELRRMLTSPSTAERVSALRELTARRDSAALGAIARIARRDPSPLARGWALRSVAALDPSAIQVLRHALLNDADPRVRDLAAELLRLPRRPSREQRARLEQAALDRAHVLEIRRQRLQLQLARGARWRARVGFGLFFSGLAIGAVGLGLVDVDFEASMALLGVCGIAWVIETPFMLTAYAQAERARGRRYQGPIIAGTIAVVAGIFLTIAQIVSNFALGWGVLNGIISPAARVFNLVVGTVAAVRARRQVRALERD